jgi:hypothetical protein
VGEVGLVVAIKLGHDLAVQVAEVGVH